MREAVIVGMVRTAVGRMGGAIARYRPEELGAFVIRGIVDKTGIDPNLVEDVVMGLSNSWHAAYNPARRAVLKAGLPYSLPGVTVERQCSSGRNDGAAAVLMMTLEKARELGYKPLARWVTCGVSGVDPKIMGIGPAYSMPKALNRAGLKMSAMDVIEINEAFAAQVLACVRELKAQGHTVDMEKLNPNGGAIAFGHPNGMSGTRIAMFLISELQRRKATYGIASLCIGGGQGLATVFERL